MELGHALKEWRRAKRLTQQEVADMLGVHRGNVASYETGQIPASREEAVRKLIGQAGPAPSTDGEVPYIGTISAGAPPNWAALIEDAFKERVPSMLATPGFFAATVEGESMYPLLHPGDLAVFQPIQTPRLSRVMLYRDAEGLATVKEVRCRDGAYYLHALNPLVDPVQVGEGSKVVGVLVGIIRRIGSRQLIHVDLSGITVQDF